MEAQTARRNEFRDELLHADGLVLGVLGEGVVRVELDGALFGGGVCEVVGVEVGLEATDTNDEFRGADISGRKKKPPDISTDTIKRRVSAEPLQRKVRNRDNR